MNFYESVSKENFQRISPVVFAVSSLLQARRYALEVCDDWDAYWILDNALWGILWSLRDEELTLACSLVHIDNFRTSARFLPAA